MSLADIKKWHWEPQPAAQSVVDSLLVEFFSNCTPAADFARRMHDETGTRFKDWVDFIQVPGAADIRARVLEVGFDQKKAHGSAACFVNDRGIFPAILLDGPFRVAIKVDSVADFLATHNLHDAPTVGDPLGQFRMARAWKGSGAELWVVERHGWRGFAPPAFDAHKAVLAQEHLEIFRRRRREFDDDHAGYAHTQALVENAVRDIGRDWACDLFFYAERDFWQRRNRAAQVQHARQAKLGLGWANHDHHTYRCSRETFKEHVKLLETLGFHCRECFYAGNEAGWGAQVMEQSETGITTFNDVDMSPEELLGDFAHHGFKDRHLGLGTVGLWCALHGQAVLQAGMHHLECMFDWHALVDQLDRTHHIRTMFPFTEFPYLRQAFTEGERWPVNPRRVDALLARGVITREQADLFKRDGAVGSHLENLERNDGFKGFNQQGVSDIIARTDPRRLAELAAEN